jgi:HSP20 family molecular chaperone IbpA
LDTLDLPSRFNHSDAAKQAPPLGGSFQRSVHLSDTVDELKVEATFNNGEVSLPKRPEAIGKQRTIPIKKG